MLIALIFSATSTVWGVPGAFAFPAASEVRLPRLEIEIPREFGTVKEEYWNPSSSSMLVHIQDAHGHYEAQNQIKNLIAHLEKAYGFSVLLLEGGDSRLDPSIYHFFKEPALNLKLGDALVKAGELSGAEMHLVEQMETQSKRTQAFGVENAEFYRDDLKLFKKVYAGEPVSSRFLAGSRAHFETLASKILSVPLRKTVRAWQKFAMNGDLVRYAAFLDVQAQKFLGLDLREARNQKAFPQILRLIRLQEIEPKIDREAVRKEKEKLAGFLRSFKAGVPLAEKLEDTIAGSKTSGQDRPELPRYFFEELYDAASPRGFTFRDYPNLSLLGQYVVLQSEMDSAPLFQEVEALSENLFSFLAKSEQERELIRFMKDLALLEKVFKLELTRKDYEEISDGLENLKQRLSPGAAERLFEQAMEFYRLAEKREDAFMENIVRRMKEGRSEKAILVTGGFHGRGMADKLKEKGMSFVSVQPRISNRDEAGNVNYLSAMRASKKTIFDRSQIGKVLTALEGSEVAARLEEISGDPDYPAYVAKQIVEKALRLAPDAVSLLAAENSSVSRLVKLDFSISSRAPDQLIVSMSFPGPKTGPQVRRFSLELSRFRPDASKFLSGFAEAASLGGKKDKGHKKKRMEERGRREKKDPAGGRLSRRQWLAAGGLLGLGAITWGVISSRNDDGGKMDRAQALAETRVLLGELIKELNGQGDPLGPYAEKLLASMKKQDPFAGLRSGLMGVARDPQAGTIAFVLNEEAWIPLLEEAGRDKRYREFLKMSLYKEASQWRVAEKDYAPRIQALEDHVRGEIIRVNDEVKRLTRTKDGDRVGVAPDETLIRFYKIAFAIRMHEESLGFLDALEYSKRHGFARQRDPGRPELLDDSPLRALRDKALREGKGQLAGKMGTHLHLLGHIAMAGRTGFPGHKAVERGIKISGSILIFMRQMDDWMSEDTFFYQTLDSLLQMEERAGLAKLDLTTGRMEISNLPSGDIPPAFLGFLTDENYYDPQKIGILPALDFDNIFIPSQGKGSSLGQPDRAAGAGWSGGDRPLGQPAPRDRRGGGLTKLALAGSLGEEFPANPYWTNIQKRLARLRDRGFIDPAFYERLLQYHAIHEKDVTIKPYGGPAVTFRANRIQHTLFPGRPAKGGIRVIYADEFARDRNFMNALAGLKARGATVEQANEFLHQWIRQMTMALALEMSFKTGLMDLPLGGAKSVIPLFEIVEKEGAFVPACVFKNANGSRPSGVELALAARALARYFAEEGIVGFDKDVPAPDRNTNPQFMAWMLDEHLKVLAEGKKKKQGTLKATPGLIQGLKSVRREEGLQILDPIKIPFATYAMRFASSRKVPELATYTGKSAELGGQSIRDQATGLGVLILAELLAGKGVWKGETDRLRDDTRNLLQGIRVATQGFGNVGQNAAILFAKRRAHVVAVSDETKGIYTASHYTWQTLANLANYVNPQLDRPRRFLRDVPFEEMGIQVSLQYDSADYLTGLQPVDILIPAAVENAITQENADKIHARVILPAANGAVTIEAEEMLWNRVDPVFVLPDILTSAGGVTMSYQEMLENIHAPLLSPKRSTRWLREKFRANFDAIWQKVDRLNHIDFGFAADILASERIKKAMQQAASLGQPDRAAGAGWSGGDRPLGQPAPRDRRGGGLTAPALAGSLGSEAEPFVPVRSVLGTEIARDVFLLKQEVFTAMFAVYPQIQQGQPPEDISPELYARFMEILRSISTDTAGRIAEGLADPEAGRDILRHAFAKKTGIRIYMIEQKVLERNPARRVAAFTSNALQFAVDILDSDEKKQAIAKLQPHVFALSAQLLMEPAQLSVFLEKAYPRILRDFAHIAVSPAEAQTAELALKQLASEWQRHYQRMSRGFWEAYVKPVPPWIGFRLSDEAVVLNDAILDILKTRYPGFQTAEKAYQVTPEDYDGILDELSKRTPALYAAAEKTQAGRLALNLVVRDAMTTAALYIGRQSLQNLSEIQRQGLFRKLAWRYGLERLFDGEILDSLQFSAGELIRQAGPITSAELIYQKFEEAVRQDEDLRDAIGKLPDIKEAVQRVFREMQENYALHAGAGSSLGQESFAPINPVLGVRLAPALFVLKNPVLAAAAQISPGFARAEELFQVSPLVYEQFLGALEQQAAPAAKRIAQALRDSPSGYQDFVEVFESRERGTVMYFFESAVLGLSSARRKQIFANAAFSIAANSLEDPNERYLTVHLMTRILQPMMRRSQSAEWTDIKELHAELLAIVKTIGVLLLEAGQGQVLENGLKHMKANWQALFDLIENNYARYFLDPVPAYLGARLSPEVVLLKHEIDAALKKPYPGELSAEAYFDLLMAIRDSQTPGAPQVYDGMDKTEEGRNALNRILRQVREAGTQVLDEEEVRQPAARKIKFLEIAWTLAIDGSDLRGSIAASLKNLLSETLEAAKAQPGETVFDFVRHDFLKSLRQSDAPQAVQDKLAQAVPAVEDYDRMLEQNYARVQGASLGARASKRLITVILGGNFEKLEDARRREGFAPWDIQLAGRNLIHLLGLPGRAASGPGLRGEVMAQFHTLTASGIYIADRPRKKSWETHFDPEFGFFVSRKTWEALADKRELVKRIVRGLVPPSYAKRIDEIPLDSLAGENQSRAIPAYLTAIYKQMAVVIKRISQESGVSAETVLDLADLLQKTKLTKNLFALFAARLKEFYAEVEAAMKKDFHDSGLKDQMGNTDEGIKFESIMSRVRKFAGRWGVVVNTQKRRNLRYLSDAFYVEKGLLKRWLGLLEIYVDPEKDKILKEKYVQANLAQSLRELAEGGEAPRIPAAVMRQMRLEIEKVIPRDNTDLYFNIKIRRILDEEPVKILEEIRKNYRHWMRNFFHHNKPREGQVEPQLEATVSVFAERTEPLIRDLRPLIKRIPIIDFVPEPEGASLGMAKLYYKARGYGARSPLTAEIVTRDVAGNVIDRFLLETEPGIFEYLYARIFKEEDTVLVPEAEPFKRDLMPGLRYLGIQPKQQAGPVIVEESILSTGEEGTEQARKIAEIAGPKGAVVLLWNYAENQGKKPALRRYLDQYAARKGILVRDFPLETVSALELNRVLKLYQQPALALSAQEKPLILEFNGEKIRIDKQFLDQYRIDPLQALALFKQILDNPPERRKELFEKAGLDFDAANGYWQVTERFITSFLRNAYSAEAARKTLAQAA